MTRRMVVRDIDRFFLVAALLTRHNMLENLYLTGSVSELADWSTDDALLMSSADYPTWSRMSSAVLIVNSPDDVFSDRGPASEHDYPVQIHHQVQRRRHVGGRPEQRDHDACERLCYAER